MLDLSAVPICRRAFACDRNTESYRGSVLLLSLPDIAVENTFAVNLILPTSCALSSDKTTLFVSHAKGVTSYDVEKKVNTLLLQ